MCASDKLFQTFSQYNVDMSITQVPRRIIPQRHKAKRIKMKFQTYQKARLHNLPRLVGRENVKPGTDITRSHL